MIDIHTHILYGVDDGSKSIDDSLAMIRECINQGVKTIVLTPHYNRNMETIEKNFAILKDKAEVNLFLMPEIFYEEDLDDYYDSLPKINGYILLEFGEASDILDALRDLSIDGKKIILAHAERYGLTLDDLLEIKKYGVLIQVNASKVIKKKGKELLDNGIVDFVASDMHNLNKRTSFMLKAYQFVEKKYGKEYASKLFMENAKDFLKIL